MAVRHVSELDGVKGESVDDKHKGEIDIESFSLGHDQHRLRCHRRRRWLGKVNISDITITKFVDMASADPHAVLR